MKDLFILILLVFLLSFNRSTSQPQAENQPLAAYFGQDSIWRVIDYSGNEMFPPVAIIELKSYSEGLLRVLTIVYGKVRWCFMNLKGQIVIVPESDRILDFSNGMAMTIITNEEAQTERYGFINRRGKQAVPTEKIDAIPFSEGKAYVMDRDSRGYIDTTGKMVLEMHDMVGYKFSEGLAPVSDMAYKVGYINHDGELVIDKIYDEPGEFSEGVASVTSGGKFGYINKEGKIVIPLIFDYTRKFKNSRSFVGIINKKHITLWALIDKNADLLSDFIFIIVKDFSDGMAAVVETDKWGFIGTDGKYLIKPQFNSAGSFVDGVSWASIMDKKYGFIGKKGEYLFEIPKPIKVVDLRLNTQVFP